MLGRVTVDEKPVRVVEGSLIPVGGSIEHHDPDTRVGTAKEESNRRVEAQHFLHGPRRPTTGVIHEGLELIAVGRECSNAVPDQMHSGVKPGDDDRRQRDEPLIVVQAAVIPTGEDRRCHTIGEDGRESCSKCPIEESGELRGRIGRWIGRAHPE